MQTILVLAAIYNFAGGLTVLFLLGWVGPLLNFNDTGPELFRLFTGGTAAIVGVAYYAVSRDFVRNRQVLVYGTAIKYWAFLISLYGFVRAELSLAVLLGFGCVNLAFAVSFTGLLLQKRGPA
jgi:hypothetical protein